MLYLQQFHFSLEHRAGKHHANADAMSRVPAVTPVLDILQKLVTDLTTIKTAQQADEVPSPLISVLTQGQSPPSATCKPPGLKKAEYCVVHSIHHHHRKVIYKLSSQTV